MCIKETISNDEDCVKSLLADFNVKALIEKIPQLENFIEVLKTYNFLTKINEELLWETYKSVIPKVGLSKVTRAAMTPVHREMIQEFRLRYLEEQNEIMR